MRGKIGTAAAPAASCRTRRRCSFMAGPLDAVGLRLARTCRLGMIVKPKTTIGEALRSYPDGRRARQSVIPPELVPRYSIRNAQDGQLSRSNKFPYVSLITFPFDQHRIFMWRALFWAEADPYRIVCPCNPQNGILKRYRTKTNTIWSSPNRRKNLLIGS